MFREITNCYASSAGNFVRVVVDTETKVLYLTNKRTMIPMISANGKPALFSNNLKITNYINKVELLNSFVGWQNLFVNEEDGTMYVGGSDILCQLIDTNGMPKIWENDL